MARRRKQLSDEEKLTKKELCAQRSKERREARKSGTTTKKAKRERKPAAIDPTDLTWIKKIGIRQAAIRILNDRDPGKYWLSIPKEVGVEPVADFYPCVMNTRGDRLFYGFMFVDHRDEQFERWDEARKEFPPGT